MFLFEADRYFNSCHASTLVVLPDGDVVAAWFAGTAEGDDDVNIWSSILHAGCWSEPRIVAEAEGEPLWNPVLFREDDTLFLTYRAARTIPQWRSYLKRSRDGGRSWSEAVPIPSGFLGPIKNKPIRMSDGIWLCGSSVETATEWYVRMELYEARTNRWFHATDIHLPGDQAIIQPAVWESAPGQVHALMRSNMGRIIRADSQDAGRSWSSPVVTELGNNNSGLDVVRLPDGHLVLCCNPVSGDWGARTPLVLMGSRDNGVTWPWRYDLETEDGEFSYPGIVAANDGVSVIYTHRRKQIRYRHISLAAIFGDSPRPAPSTGEENRTHN